jgi:ferredoxin/copper chaperone CopZ
MLEPVELPGVIANQADGLYIPAAVEMERRQGRALRHVRWTVQAAVLGAALFAGVRLAMSLGGTGVERYCPFGGLETAWSVVTRGTMSCATGEHNITLMAALLLSALLVRKGFCSWICPVGTIGEWLARIGGRLGFSTGRRRRLGMAAVPPRLDRGLRWLRLPVLAVILVATALTGELVFRTYDPYYILFSLGGHDVHAASWLLVAGLLAGAILVPMAWCRWLCPLGAALWPASRVSLARLGRDSRACTGCGSCDAACPHSLQVSGLEQVRSGECTLCMECTAACPAPGALRLQTARRPLSAWAVPVMLLLLAAAGVAGGSAIAIPSFSRHYDTSTSPDGTRRVTMVVDGIRCVDTARKAAAQLEGVAGVRRFTAYASRGEATIEYDGTSTDVDELRRAIEGPVHDEASGRYIFHAYTVLEVEEPR